MLRAPALLACLVLLAGCAAPGSTPSPDAAVDTGTLPVRALYWNDCPPDTTCAPVGGGAGKAEVLLDGVLGNVTDQWGEALLANVTVGDHVVCVRHPDLGADERVVHVAAGRNDRLELMLRRSHPACS